MKPSEKIEEIINKKIDEARKQNAEAHERGAIGDYSEDRSYYIIPAMIEVMDMMAEKTKLAGMGFGDFLSI